jgi:hypothetical protein
MSRTWVSNDLGTVMAEVVQDDEGYASASCGLGDWATETGRFDTVAAVIDHAGTHMDQRH